VHAVIFFRFSISNLFQAHAPSLVMDKDITGSEQVIKSPKVGPPTAKKPIIVRDSFSDSASTLSDSHFSDGGTIADLSLQIVEVPTATPEVPTSSSLTSSWVSTTSVELRTMASVPNSLTLLSIPSFSGVPVSSHQGLIVEKNGDYPEASSSAVEESSLSPTVLTTELSPLSPTKTIDAISFGEYDSKESGNLESFDYLRVKDGDDFISYEDAVRRGIVNERTRTVQYDGRRMLFSEAAREGVMTAHVVALPTLAELKHRGLYNADTGMVCDARTGQKISLQEAIENGGVVDRDSIRLRDPINGGRISLTEAFERGILDPDTGDLVDSRRGRKVSFSESVKEGLLGEETNAQSGTIDKLNNESKQVKSEANSTTQVKNTTTSMALSYKLSDAISEGILDLKTNTATDPVSGRQMTFAQALECKLINTDALMIEDPSTGQTASFNTFVNLNLIDLRRGLFTYSNGQNQTLESVVHDGLFIESPQFSGKILCQIIEDGLYDRNTGGFHDPITDELLTLQEATECGMLDILSVVVRNPNSCEVLGLADAMKAGLVNAKTSSVRGPNARESLSLAEAVEQGIVVERPMSLTTAVDIGLYNETTGKFLDPTCRQFFTLQQAIDKGLIDPDSTVIDPATGRPIVLRKAIKTGVLDPVRGNMTNVHTREELSLKDAMIMGRLMRDTLIDDEDEGMSLKVAVEKGLFCPETGVITDPHSGKDLSIVEAMHAGILDPSTPAMRVGGRDVFLLEAIEKGYIDPFKPERSGSLLLGDDFSASSGSETLSIQEAVNQGILVDGIITDPKSGNRMPLLNAIDAGIIDGSMVVTISGRTVNLRQALQENLIDPKTGSVLDSKTQRMVNFLDAFSTGIVKKTQTMPSKTISEDTRTTIIPTTNEDMSFSESIASGLITRDSITFKHPSTGQKMTFTEAVDARIVDPETGDVLSPKGDTLTQKEAIFEGMAMCETNESKNISLSLIDALKQGMYNPTTGKFIWNNSGKEDTLADSIASGRIDRNKSRILDPMTGRELTIDEAGEAGLINLTTGQLMNPSTKKSVSFTEALADGLVIDASMSLAQAIDGELFNVNTGRFTDPLSGREMPLDEALKGGFIDPKRTVISDPRSGKMVSLDVALATGLIDPITGDIINDGMRVSIIDAIDAGLVADVHVPPLRSFDESLRAGLFDVATESFTHPVTQERLNFADAVSSGLLDPGRCALYLPDSEMKIMLSSALEQGFVDEEYKTITDPTSQKSINLIKALTDDRLLEDEKQVTIEEAVSHGGILKDRTLASAITEGLLDVNRTVLNLPGQAASIGLADAITSGIVDPVGGTIRDPNTGLSVSIFDAVERGILCSTNISPVHALTLFDLVNNALFDTDSCTVDVGIDQRMTFAEALAGGYLDMSTIFFQDGSTSDSHVDFKSACENGWIDIDTGRISSIHEQAGISLLQAVALGILYDSEHQFYSLVELQQSGLFDEHTGKFEAASSDSEQNFGILQAVEMKLIDPTELLLQFPNSGNKTYTLEYLVHHGLVNDNHVTNPITGDTLSVIDLYKFQLTQIDKVGSNEEHTISVNEVKHEVNDYSKATNAATDGNQQRTVQEDVTERSMRENSFYCLHGKDSLRISDDLTLIAKGIDTFAKEGIEQQEMSRVNLNLGENMQCKTDEQKSGVEGSMAKQAGNIVRGNTNEREIKVEKNGEILTAEMCQLVTNTLECFEDKIDRRILRSKLLVGQIKDVEAPLNKQVDKEIVLEECRPDDQTNFEQTSVTAKDQMLKRGQKDDNTTEGKTRDELNQTELLKMDVREKGIGQDINNIIEITETEDSLITKEQGTREDLKQKTERINYNAASLKELKEGTPTEEGKVENAIKRSIIPEVICESSPESVAEQGRKNEVVRKNERIENTLATENSEWDKNMDGNIKEEDKGKALVTDNTLRDEKTIDPKRQSTEVGNDETSEERISEISKQVADMSEHRGTFKQFSKDQFQDKQMQKGQVKEGEMSEDTSRNSEATNNQQISMRIDMTNRITDSEDFVKENSMINEIPEKEKGLSKDRRYETGVIQEVKRGEEITKEKIFEVDLCTEDIIDEIIASEKYVRRELRKGAMSDDDKTNKKETPTTISREEASIGGMTTSEKGIERTTDETYLVGLLNDGKKTEVRGDGTNKEVVSGDVISRRLSREEKADHQFVENESNYKSRNEKGTNVRRNDNIADMDSSEIQIGEDRTEGMKEIRNEEIIDQKSKERGIVEEQTIPKNIREKEISVDDQGLNAGIINQEILVLEGKEEGIILAQAVKPGNFDSQTGLTRTKTIELKSEIEIAAVPYGKNINDGNTQFEIDSVAERLPYLHREVVTLSTDSNKYKRVDEMPVNISDSDIQQRFILEAFGIRMGISECSYKGQNDNDTGIDIDDDSLVVENALMANESNYKSVRTTDDNTIVIIPKDMDNSTIDGDTEIKTDSELVVLENAYTECESKYRSARDTANDNVVTFKVPETVNKNSIDNALIAAESNYRSVRTADDNTIIVNNPKDTDIGPIDSDTEIKTDSELVVLENAYADSESKYRYVQDTAKDNVVSLKVPETVNKNLIDINTGVEFDIESLVLENAFTANESNYSSMQAAVNDSVVTVTLPENPVLDADMKEINKSKIAKGSPSGDDCKMVTDSESVVLQKALMDDENGRSSRQDPVHEAFISDTLPADSVLSTNEKETNPSNIASGRMSIEDAMSQGLFDASCGRFLDANTRKEIPFCEAIELMVDVSTVCVRHPVTNETLSVEQAIHEGIIDSQTGFFNSANNKPISLEQAIALGYIIGWMARDLASKGSAQKQKDQEFIKGESVLTLETDLNKHGKSKIMSEREPSISKISKRTDNLTNVVVLKEGTFSRASDLAGDDKARQPYDEKLSDGKTNLEVEGLLGMAVVGFSLKQAIDAGLFDSEKGVFMDPRTGIHHDFKSAIELGILDGSSKAMLDPLSGEVLSLNEAIVRGHIDEVTAKTKYPTFEFSENTLLESNFKVESSLGVQYRSSRESQNQSPIKSQGLSLKDAIDAGLYDSATGRFKNLETGTRITVEDAIKAGLLYDSSVNIVNPNSEVQARDMNLCTLGPSAQDENICMREERLPNPDNRDASDVKDLLSVDTLVSGSLSSMTAQDSLKVSFSKNALQCFGFSYCTSLSRVGFHGFCFQGYLNSV